MQPQSMGHFVYRLIPPRGTFAADMTESEGAVMGEHAAYWTDLLERGSVKSPLVALRESRFSRPPSRLGPSRFGH